MTRSTNSELRPDQGWLTGPGSVVLCALTLACPAGACSGSEGTDESTLAPRAPAGAVPALAEAPCAFPITRVTVAPDRPFSDPSGVGATIATTGGEVVYRFMGKGAWSSPQPLERPSTMRVGDHCFRTLGEASADGEVVVLIWPACSQDGAVVPACPTFPPDWVLRGESCRLASQTPAGMDVGVAPQEARLSYQPSSRRWTLGAAGAVRWNLKTPRPMRCRGGRTAGELSRTAPGGSAVTWEMTPQLGRHLHYLARCAAESSASGKTGERKDFEELVHWLRSGQPATGSRCNTPKGDAPDPLGGL